MSSTFLPTESHSSSQGLWHAQYIDPLEKLVRASLIAQSVKNLPAMQENCVLFLGGEKSSGEGNGSPLQYSHVENPIEREAWPATVHGITRVRHDLATKPPPLPP